MYDGEGTEYGQMSRVVSTVAVAAIVVMSGCAGSIPGLDDGSGGQTEPVTYVPADVDTVATVDADVASDETTRSLLNTLFEESDQAPGDPSDVDEAADEFQRQLNDNLSTNLSLEEIDGVAVFARTPDEPQTADVDQQQYAGAILSVDWNREDVLENLRETASVKEDDYDGVTVYEVVNETTEEPLYTAQYESGLWVFSGNRSTVEDVIDVSQGDADTFGGDLKAAYDQTREDAYVRYAVTVSDRQRGTIRQVARRSGSQAPVDLTQFGDVVAYSGAYYTEDDQVGVSTYLTATNESSAQRLNQTIGSLVRLGQGTVEPGTPQAAQLNALSTEQDGRTLEILYEIDVETLQEFVREQSSTPALVAPSPAVTATGAAAPVR
jgi:hypothetical protein